MSHGADVSTGWVTEPVVQLERSSREGSGQYVLLPCGPLIVQLAESQLATLESELRSLRTSHEALAQERTRLGERFDEVNGQHRAAQDRIAVREVKPRPCVHRAVVFLRVDCL